jgi:O-antigen biosynthesis protein
MLQLCQRDGVGAVGAKLYYENDRLQHVGVAFWNGLPDHIQKGFMQNEPGYFFSAVANRNYLAVTGAAILTKRKLFLSVGGFDERFPINYNDIDYCLKLFEKGNRIVFAASAKLYHYESVSREAKVDQTEIDLFHLKWSNFLSYDPYYSHYLENHPPIYSLRTELNICEAQKLPETISTCVHH